MVQTRSQTAKAASKAAISIAETTPIYENAFDEETAWQHLEGLLKTLYLKMYKEMRHAGTSEDDNVPTHDNVVETIMAGLLMPEYIYNKLDQDSDGSSSKEALSSGREGGQTLVCPLHKCQGCLEDQPNQMAHIGPNGCLGKELY